MDYMQKSGPISRGVTVEEGPNAVVGIAAATVVKVGAGRCFRVSVVVAGSAVGTVNDCAATGDAAAGNQFGTLPNTVGTYSFNWPFETGLTITPGTGQTVAVTYG